MVGALTDYETRQILKNQRLGRLACQSDGNVYIVPIAYAFDGRYIYAHSREGQKINMMRKNPKVCFEVDVMKDLANWQSVIVQGEYEELMGESARNGLAFFVENMATHISSETSFPPNGMLNFHHQETSIVKTIVFRIRITEITGRFEKSNP